MHAQNGRMTRQIRLSADSSQGLASNDAAAASSCRLDILTPISMLVEAAHENA